MNTILEVRGVTKRFGGLVAVSDVSFNLAEGEILGLIGPNGAGKTTLFNVVNGVYKADQGTITFAGRDITRCSPDRVVHFGLARTHQVVKPLNDLTVLDNVTVGACFGREYLDLAAARKVASEVLEQVGLGDRTTMMARSLTIAGKKRLEVARALAAKPKLLLLDEVLAGLNPTEVVKMIELVRKIRDSGVSVLMIEHLMQAIMSLSDRIVVLNLGRKLAEGPPDEVVHNSEVVEAYLGFPEKVHEWSRVDKLTRRK
jgi:branched-chain amino acid transport system ATP-binding protein